MSSARYIVGDVLEVLAALEPGSVDLVLTSPPFLALRSYLPADHPDKPKEIGSEATPADFLDTLLDVTEACSRVLAPHGSLCFELGDTYSGSGGAGGDYGEGGLRDGQQAFIGSGRLAKYADQRGNPDGMRDTTFSGANTRVGGGAGWPLAKSLCGIPTLFAWSLAYGRNLLRPERTTPPWRIRNVVAWVRPNPPVGALGDKFRPATSYMTVATKARDRYFDLDAVRGEGSPNTHARTAKGVASRPSTGKSADDERRGGNFSTLATLHSTAGAPPLDHWIIPTQPYEGAHYATWPEQLCVRPIKAMCPLKVCTTCGQPSRRVTERSELVKAAGRDITSAGNVTVGWTDCGHNTWRTGIVLDPFAGSGTTLAVATGHGRDAIGIDLDARNATLAVERIGPLLCTTEHPTKEGTAA